MTTPKGRNRRVNGGSLLLISLLLFGSALLRLGVQAGPAISREMHQSTGRNVAASPFAELGSLEPILVAFQAREKEIKAQEDLILDRLKALSIAETALDRKLAELIGVEKKLRATIALADGAAEGDLDQLTGVYEKMKSKNAAALFEKMDPKFAAGFLARMRPVAAANILAGLTPETAYTISLIFAGRNANVPKD